MNPKMNVKRCWMAAGLFAMGMMAQNVWAQESETVPTAKSDHVKAVTPEESQVQEPHVTVEINVSLVFFPQVFIEALTRKPGSPSEEDLIKAWREGKGRLVASHLMLSKPDQEVVIKGESEHVYPTEFNLTDGGVPETTTISESVPETISEAISEPVLEESEEPTEKPTTKATAPATKTVTTTKPMTVERTVTTGKIVGGTAGTHRAVQPVNFTTRTTGFVTQTGIAIENNDVKTIKVTARLGYTVREHDRMVGAVRSGIGDTSIQMAQPEFHSMSVEFSRVCSDGHTAVQGGQLSSDGKEMGYFFITPRIAKIPKAAQSNENDKEIKQIETRQLLVHFPKTLIEAFARASGAAAPSEDQIQKAWREGKGRLVASSFSIAPSFWETVVRDVKEYIYPSEFSVSGGSPRNNDVLWTIEPQNFLTRELGFVFQFIPGIIDAQTIEVTYKPQYVCRGADHKIDVAQSLGDLQQVVQPEFFSQSVESCWNVRNGQTAVTGGMLSADGQEMGYFLVTPKIVKSQK